MNRLCDTQTTMIIFMRNESSILQKIKISYQFHRASDAERFMTFKKQLKIN